MRLLGIVGSLRAGSHSRAVLRRLAELSPVAFDLAGIAGVPLYNEDLDRDPLPAPVAALKQAIERADGLVICSPEYNHGMPGVLKNAIDWVSRPARRSVLAGKPALIITTSVAFTGGVRAQSQIREALAATAADVSTYPEIVIGQVDQKLVDGRFDHAPTLEFAAQGLVALVNAIERGAERTRLASPGRS